MTLNNESRLLVYVFVLQLVSQISNMQADAGQRDFSSLCSSSLPFLMRSFIFILLSLIRLIKESKAGIFMKFH